MIGTADRLPVIFKAPMQRIRRHRSLLHFTLVLLVAIGVLLQPVLGALGDLHDAEHAAAVQSDHGHSHHDGHDEPIGDDEALGDPIGTHILLHQGGVATSMALPEPSFRLLSPTPAGEPSARTTPAPPIAVLTLPFRPPIV